jgi:hypothetical protein
MEPQTEIARPRLVGTLEHQEDALFVDSGGERFSLDVDALPRAPVIELLQRLDGTRTIGDLASEMPALGRPTISAIVADLDRQGLLRDEQGPACRSGRDVLLELEDLQNELLYRTLYQNVFWRKLLDTEERVPLFVLHGMCIENYHFLFRESYFDAPVLNFPASTPARREMNEFYVEELGHDELLFKSLQAIGISRAEIAETIPLPETMALCNALAYWSRYDPLFFFTTLGVMEGKDLEIDSYVTACERHGLPEAFIGPIRTHAEINVKGGHGNLAREIFQHVEAIPDDVVRRMRAQTHLFVEIYDDFYTAIWNHYSQTPTLLRRISAI